MKSIFETINLFVSFTAGLLGGAAVMLLAHPIVKILNGSNPLLGAKNVPDVMAIANTYIVFTTFIFVLLTIAITGAGIWFARWFGISKEKELPNDFIAPTVKKSELRQRMRKIEKSLHAASDAIKTAEEEYHYLVYGVENISRDKTG